MNKHRRARITELASQIETLREEVMQIQEDEQTALDALPESLQQGTRGDSMQQAIDALEGASDAISEAITFLETARND